MGWNDLLRSFTVLALCWAGAEKMLQEGRLRQAARMVFGLLSLLVWLSGLQGLLAQVLPAGTESPETLLEAGMSSEAAGCMGSICAAYGLAGRRSPACRRMRWPGGGDAGA